MNAAAIIGEFKLQRELSETSVQHILENGALKLELLAAAHDLERRALSQWLLRHFILLRKSDQEVTCDDLVFAALMLGEHRQVEDCLLIWEAKECDFDTYCGLDIQTMVFSGIERTESFLREQKTEQAQRALHYVLDCLKAGDFEDLTNYPKKRKTFWEPPEDHSL